MEGEAGEEIGVVVLVVAAVVGTVEMMMGVRVMRVMRRKAKKAMGMDGRRGVRAAMMVRVVCDAEVAVAREIGRPVGARGVGRVALRAEDAAIAVAAVLGEEAAALRGRLLRAQLRRQSGRRRRTLRGGACGACGITCVRSTRRLSQMRSGAARQPTR